MRFRLGLIFGLLNALCAQAQTPPATVDLTPLVCVPHGDLVTAMTAAGAVMYPSSMPDGRKLEFYRSPNNAWTSVVVQRPKGGRVTATMCSIIFGLGDPGVSIPPAP